MKLLQVVLGAAAGVAHPAEAASEELTDVGDAVVVQTVHHAFDDGTPDWSDYIVATSARNRSWCKCTSNSVDGCNEVD